MCRISRIVVTLLAICVLAEPGDAQGQPMRVATFAVDASPPVGSPMAYDIT
jgi:hypothetical protein